MSGSYAKISSTLVSQLTAGATSAKGSVPMAIAIIAPRGSTDPLFFSKDLELVKEYSEPDLAYGKSLLYADTLIKEATDDLCVVRAVSADSKYAGALVRAKIGTQNLTDLSVPIVVDTIIKGVAGLTQEELDSYQFPLYPQTRKYEKALSNYAPYFTDDNSIWVSSLETYVVGDLFALGTPTVEPLVNADLYSVKTVNNVLQTKQVDKVVCAVGVKVVDSTKALYLLDENSTKQRLLNVHQSSELSFSGSQELIVEFSDYLQNTVTYNIVDELDVVVSTAQITSKTDYALDCYEVEFNSRPLGNFYAETLYEVIAKDFTSYDAGLVVSRGQGLDNKNISIGIYSDKATENSFKVRVYYKGVQKEEHKVSMLDELDGDGIQLEVGSKINANSRYIKWVTNPAMVDANGQLMRPLDSDKTIWQREQDIHFRDASIATVEDIVQGDLGLAVDVVTGLSVNDRFQVQLWADDSLLHASLEYKVLAIDAVNKVITLDRPFESTEDTMVAGSAIYKYDASYEDAPNNIYEGYQKYVAQSVDTVYPLSKDSYEVIGTNNGYVWDGGVNQILGGHDGSPVTTNDLNNCLNKITDTDMYPHFFIADGGFTDSEHIRNLAKHAEGRIITHAFTSCKLASEFAIDPVSAIQQDRDDVLYSSSFYSFTADWFYMTNPYTGQVNIPMAPSLSDLLVEAGAITTDGLWTAGAGWRKGKYFTSGLVRKKSLPEREKLYSSGINTTKYKRGKGVAKWSDLTALNQERPLQYRSAAKLAIYIIANLNNYLEDVEFEDYDPIAINGIEEDIKAFLSGVLNAGGIYDFQIVIKELITDAYVTARKLPIYVAVNNKQFIQGIDFALDLQSGTVTTVDLVEASKLTA